MVVIAISGQPCAGSSTVGKLLAKKLRLKHFSPGEYFKKQAMEKSKESQTKRTSEFLKDSVGGSEAFHKKLDGLQVKHAKKGKIVIDAKLAIKMLAEYADLKVWIKCDKKVRAERVAGREGLGEKEAMRILEDRENTERSVFRRIYGFDTFDQEKEADLIIDSSNKTPEQIVDEIIAAWKARKKQ